jgi:hypothetical protein
MEIMQTTIAISQSNHAFHRAVHIALWRSGD